LVVVDVVEGAVVVAQAAHEPSTTSTSPSAAERLIRVTSSYRLLRRQIIALLAATVRTNSRS